MAAPRIPIAWILLIAIAAVIVFFGFQIFQAYMADNSKGGNEMPVHKLGFGGHTKGPAAMNMDEYDPMMEVGHPEMAAAAAPVMVQHTRESLPVPHIPAQTEEDVRATRPVMETPPDVTYDEPMSKDPYEDAVHNEAEFGDNLRHPEQMMEMHPPMGSMRVPASGLGSDQSFDRINDSVPYSPEMAQNGGEFMSGIMAFESESAGVGYSAI
jgi:hypothetical protein